MYHCISYMHIYYSSPLPHWPTQCVTSPVTSASEIPLNFQILLSPISYHQIISKNPMEICIDSLQSANNAIRGGATRLEVCSSLSEGGLTPTPGLVHAIKSHNPKIALYCMIRIKPGNFVYSRTEMDAMLFDLAILTKNGADGFVFGALTTTFEIDKRFCQEIVSAAAPKKVTFHRAFDEVKEPFVALEDVINLGFERILTSGQENTAMEGLELVRKLVARAEDRIIIMPGSGISPDNISIIKETSGGKEFHASAKIRDDEAVGNKVQMAAKEAVVFVASEGLVRKMVEIINII